MSSGRPPRPWGAYQRFGVAFSGGRDTVVMQSGEASTPKLRRETANYCRTEIAKVMKAIAGGAQID
jgi:hypothetical protein